MKNKKWIVANNGLDIHVADESFYEVATAFSKEDAQLIAASPDLYNALNKAYLDILNIINEGEFKEGIHWNSSYIEDALKKARGE